VEERLGFSKSAAGPVFGGITAMMGLLGTGFGGWLLDRMRQSAGCIDVRAASDDSARA
jgi:hypothetical protein